MSKSKAKGNENNPPARRDMRKPTSGRGLEPIASNSFVVLQNMEAQLSILAPPTCEEPMGDNNMGLLLANNINEKPKSGCSLPQTERALGTLEDQNSRGTGAKSFPALVRDLKTHYRLDFIAILETRCTREVSQGRAQQLGFPNMELIDYEGYSGGIWCLWEHSITSISLIERHHQFIHLQVTEAAGCSRTLTVVYTSPTCVSWRVLW
ncbi:hypothetical protein K1719_020284 [Acacia pycnantha]|nr:hypothetical protein K1719_020284 [Acacia pycnantha]